MHEHLELAEKCATLEAERGMVQQAMDIINKALEEKEEALQNTLKRVQDLENQVSALKEEVAQSEISANLLREANAELKHRLSGGDV
jgi:predicted  nucleic acid-binding Zn-ribbon protein